MFGKIFEKKYNPYIPGVEGEGAVAAGHVHRLELLLLLLVAPLAARGLHDVVHLLGEPPPLLAAHHAPLLLPRLHQEQHLGRA